jgi:uncharacterized protein DUF6962
VSAPGRGEADALGRELRVAGLEEPMTAITDYVLAAMGIGFAVVTLDAAHTHGAGAMPMIAWGLGFACVALGAALGGTVHGFASRLGAWRRRLWKATQAALGGAGFWMTVALVLAMLPSPPREWLVALATVKLVVYLLVSVRSDRFAVVIADQVASTAIVTVSALYGHLEWRAPSAPWIVLGVVVSLVGAMVQRGGRAPHPRFNHNDLYHVIEMVALLFFFRGGLLLVDR